MRCSYEELPIWIWFFKSIRNMKNSVPSSHFLPIHGLQMHYLDWGNETRKPMVLLHGVMGHAHLWDNVALFFMDRYHVIALDQRGHGQSQPCPRGSYALDDHFIDITAFFDTLKLSDLILMGHSMGGRNALFFAALSPNTVSRLILVEARLGNNPTASFSLRQIVAHLPHRVKSLDEAMAAISLLFPRIDIDECRRIARFGFRRVSRRTFVCCYDPKMTFDAAKSGFIVLDLRPFLKNVTCPTLVVRGGDSPFVSREEAKEMSELMPNATWGEILEATHMPALENPKAFLSLVSSFLENRS